MIQLPSDIDVVTTIDPGKMTGLSVIDRDGTFFSFEMGFDETCRTLMEMANTSRERMIIGAESFIIGPQTIKNTQAPWSLELIGVARMVSRLYTGRELFLQSPAQAKRFSSDARLKHLGWHRPGKGHANDAARHLLLVMVTRGWLSADRVLELAAVV